MKSRIFSRFLSIISLVLLSAFFSTAFLPSKSFSLEESILNLQQYEEITSTEAKEIAQENIITEQKKEIDEKKDKINKQTISMGNTYGSIFSHNITKQEFRSVWHAMEARDINGPFEVELLYDADNNPAYLLGYSDSGYQIVSREGLLCLEGGEANPYARHISNKKYYGGIMEYYSLHNGQYYDIVQETFVNKVEQAGYLDALRKDIFSTSGSNIGFASSMAKVTRTHVIPNAYSRIQRKAFGYNNDNTCSAVACTIVLNYLDYINPNIVPLKYTLENLTSKKGSNVASDSPKAHAFHQFLVKDCGMGAVSYGNSISNAIASYRNSSTAIRNTGITCKWTFNINTNFGYDELNANRPIVITSTIAGPYKFHTMPVYGYRWFDDNSFEWLIHTGWYTSLEGSSVFYMPKIWVGASTATYLYNFTFNGM